MEKMTLREAFQSLEDIKDECWEYSSSKTSTKKLNENKTKKSLKESMSWGDCADVEQAWDAYKKEIGYTYTGDSSDAITFIDKYVKEHPELDNDEDRDSIFTQISMIEEPSDIEEGCKKESKLKEMYEPISSFKDFTFIDKTNQGWEVKKVYRDLDDDRMHVVVYRPKRNDYAVGLGYSPESGNWNQGWYDYKNIEDAISDLKNEYNVEDYVAKKESCNDESSKKFFKRDKKEEVCKECDTNKKSLKERINDTYQSGNVVATTETRHTPMKNYGYVNLTVNGNTYRGKQSWINRTWEVFFLQTALLDAIRKSGLVTDEQIDELRKYNNFQGTLDAFSEIINKKDECITESKQLTEAEKIDINNEEDIEKGKELIKDNKEKETEDNVEQIVDVDAETIDQLKDSYVGNAILQCGVCRTLIYKKPDLLVRDEENDKLWNVGEQCPHCGSEDGYELVGQVATMDTDIDNTEEQTTGKEDVTTEDETQVDNSIEPQTTEENEYEDDGRRMV